MTTSRLLLIDQPGPLRAACETALTKQGFEMATADEPGKAFAELAQLSLKR